MIIIIIIINIIIVVVVLVLVINNIVAILFLYASAPSIVDLISMIITSRHHASLTVAGVPQL
jgi:hypothetical protein